MVFVGIIVQRPTAGVPTMDPRSIPAVRITGFVQIKTCALRIARIHVDVDESKVTLVHFKYSIYIIYPSAGNGCQYRSNTKIGNYM